MSVNHSVFVSVRRGWGFGGGVSSQTEFDLGNVLGDMKVEVKN